MNHDQLVAVAQRMLDHALAGTTASHPDGARRNAIYGIVEREDYWVSANVQKNFNARLQSHTTFGANEPSLINMHRTFRRKVSLPLVDEPAKA